MSADSVPSQDTNSASLLANVSDDFFLFKYIEIVPLTRDTDRACTTDRDSGDWSAQVKQENLPAVKQKPEDVCCIHSLSSSDTELVHVPEQVVAMYTHNIIRH